jgi:hypothetical protein
MSVSIPEERIRLLNSHPTRQGGSYVLYAMQAAQRVDDNPAWPWPSPEPMSWASRWLWPFV